MFWDLEICRLGPCPESGPQPELNKSSFDKWDLFVFPQVLEESIDLLKTQLDAWLVRYNTQRPYQGKRCQGKTPMETFMENLPLAKEKMWGIAAFSLVGFA